MQHSSAAVITVLLASLGYGALGFFSHHLRALGVSLETLLLLRFGLSAVFLWPLARRHQAPLKVCLQLFLVGAVVFAIQATSYFAAIESIGVSRAAILLYSYPCLVMLLDWFLNGSRPRVVHVVCLLFLLLGSYLSLLPVGGGQTFAPLGIAFGMGAALIYSFFLLVCGRLGVGVHPLLATFWVSFGAAAAFGLSCVVMDSPLIPHEPVSILWLIGMALFSTVLPMAGVFMAVRYLGATFTALLATTELVFAVLIGVVFLQETFTTAQLLGAVLVFGTVVFLQRIPKI